MKIGNSRRHGCHARGHIGRLVWHMPKSASVAFREFGIALFFAGVGKIRNNRCDQGGAGSASGKFDAVIAGGGDGTVNEAINGLMSSEAIASKLNAHQRGLVPLGATRLTMFVDVHKKVLFYCVCGWQEDFTGFVIDYGTFLALAPPSLPCAAGCPGSR